MPNTTFEMSIKFILLPQQALHRQLLGCYEVSSIVTYRSLHRQPLGCYKVHSIVTYRSLHIHVTIVRSTQYLRTFQNNTTMLSLMHRHSITVATPKANAKGKETFSIRDNELTRKTSAKQDPSINVIKKCLQKYQQYFDGVCPNLGIEHTSRKLLLVAIY